MTEAVMEGEAGGGRFPLSLSRRGTRGVTAGLGLDEVEQFAVGGEAGAE